MTYKDTIDWCNQFENNLVSVDIDVKRRTLALQAMRVCKEALEKQIPKKVEVIDKNYGIYTCPTCGESVRHMVYKYCCRCGQELDWSEE